MSDHDLVRMIHGPVAARPMTGQRSVVVYASRGQVRLMGTCPMCGTEFHDWLSPVTYVPRGRRYLFLGSSPARCDTCEIPIWWEVTRRHVRKYRRHWTRYQGRCLSACMWE